MDLQAPTRRIVSDCTDLRPLTGQQGDVVLANPFMLHTASVNRASELRLICNSSVMLREPMRFDPPTTGVERASPMPSAGTASTTDPPASGARSTPSGSAAGARAPTFADRTHAPPAAETPDRATTGAGVPTDESAAPAES